MGVVQRLLNIFRAKANKVLDRVEDPRDSLDLSYEKQVENLQKIRRSVAEVGTARKRIEMQAAQLEQQATKLQDQARQALGQNREDLAREALSRRAAIGAELTDLQAQQAQIADQEEKLALTAQRLQSQVATFRTRKETMKATYTAAQAQASIGEAAAGISESMGDAGMTIQRAQDKISAHAGPSRGHRRAAGLGCPHRSELEHRRHPGQAEQGVGHLPGRHGAGRPQDRARRHTSGRPPGRHPPPATRRPATGPPVAPAAPLDQSTHQPEVTI